MGRRHKLGGHEGQEVTLDLSGLKSIQLQCKKLERRTIQWGYIRNLKYPQSDLYGRGGWNVAQVAAIHEFGIGVNKRPFFSQSLVDARQFLNSGWIEKVFLSALENTEFDGMLDFIGQELSKTIKIAILRQNFYPISPATIALKASNNHNTEILQATQKLSDSPSHKVLHRKLQSGESK